MSPLTTGRAAAEVFHLRSTWITLNSLNDVRFEIFSEVTVKNAVFWDVSDTA
jgi:hypothetical protein